MIYNRKALKTDAKGLISAGGFELLWKTALYLIIIATVAQLSARITGIDVYTQKVVEAAQEVGEAVSTVDQDAAVEKFTAALTTIPQPAIGASLLAFLLSLVTAFLMAGFRWWCLLVVRRQPNDFRNFFDGFNFPLQLFALSFLQGLVIIIGYLLFILPGIVLGFVYSQAALIMFENPDKGPIQCMRESRQMMAGQKWKLFVLILSFIGWALLANIISDTIAGLLTTFGLGFLAMYSSVFFGMWYNTYTGLTYAGFYNYLTGYVPQEPVIETTEIEEDNDDDYRF